MYNFAPFSRSRRLEFLNELLRRHSSTTVSLITTHHVAAGTSREFADDRPRQSIAQRGDGIGHVTLGALGSREVCNLRVGKAFLIEWSFFWSRHV